MGVGSNLLASVTGNPVEAVITIIDRRTLTETQVKKATTVRTSNGPDTQVAQALEDIQTAIADIAYKTVGELPIGEYNPNAMGTVKKSMKVQFNPESISFQAIGGDGFQVMDFSGDTADKKTGGKSLSSKKVDPRISVTIPLIFDAENNADAFLQDKLIMSPTSIMKNLATAAATLFGGAEFSVQKQVEGLVAVLRNEYTREITFTWSEMSYSGLISGVDVQYTMFSPTGKPIRAKVNLSILCYDTTVKQGDMGQWADRYNDCFLNPTNIIKNAKAGQQVSSILNI